MGLEAATFIQSLVETNPVGATDERRFGDDHLRLIKSTLKATFPEGTAALRFLRTEHRNADTGALGVADKAKYIIADTNYTQSFASAATLGNGWWCMFRNNTLVQTLACGLSITINGIASPFAIYPGEDIMVITDGTSFFGFGLKDRVFMDFRGGAFASGCEFGNIGALAPRFKAFEVEWDAIIPGTNATNLHLQTSANNGSTWTANYDHVRHVADNLGGNAATGAIADTKVVLGTSFATTNSAPGIVRLVPANQRASWDLNYVSTGGLGIVSGWAALGALPNAVRLLFSSGVIAAGASDAVRLYGIAR